ncbi:MAG: cytochrome c family protein [Ignavibacteriota bacterium]
MYKIFSSLVSIIITVILSGLIINCRAQNGEHKYVGVKLCGMCHKTEAVGKQYVIWENSKHAHAYKTLTTAEADQVAKEKGYTTKAVETEECLKCHVTGYKVDASLFTDKFNISDGIQCEACHGPGSDYKSKKIMEDKKLAVENGLKIYESPEQLCVTCHNEESPSFKGFNFKEMWAKIEHSVPKK